MSTFLHIVHPHCYKMRPGDGITIGRLAEYDERDRRVMELVHGASERGLTSLVHHEVNESDAELFTKYGALVLDSRLNALLTLPSICTLRTGNPRPDNRPDRVSEAGWTHIRKVVTSHSDYLARVNRAQRHIFIGGMLEECVTSVACYTAHHSGKQVDVIEGLCAVWNPENLARARDSMQEHGVRLITPEDL